MENKYIVSLNSSYYSNQEIIFDNKETAFNYALSMSKISLVTVSIDNNLILSLDNRYQ